MQVEVDVVETWAFFSDDVGPARISELVVGSSDVVAAAVWAREKLQVVLS